MSQRSPGLLAEPTASRDMARVAVVLMNLGGPDLFEAVQPFLYQPVQRSRHHPFAVFSAAATGSFRGVASGSSSARYLCPLGGRSPLFANTEAQAQALEAVLGPELSLLCRDALLASAERRDGA